MQGEQNHLAQTVFLNATVFFTASLGYWIISKIGLFSEAKNLELNALLKIPWWYLTPGLCGFLIVLLTPESIAKLGAPTTFSIIIATQLGASLFYEVWFEKQNPNIFSLAGISLVAAGASLLLFAKNF